MADSIGTPEEWRAIPGYEGAYEVSDLGRVRSLDRMIHSKDGRRPHFRAGTMLAPASGMRAGHLRVNIGKSDSRLVHQLVLEAFFGPREDGMQVRHLNGIPTDNRLANLKYGTASENQRDAVEHRAHWCSAKTLCKRGHPLSGDNLVTYTHVTGRPARQCLACKRARGRLSDNKRRARSA